MTTLTEFLKARIDEDEQHAQKDLWAVARSTAQGDWNARYGYNLPQSRIMAGLAYIAEFTSHRTSRPLADGEDDLHASDVGLACRMVRAAKPRAERMLREVEAKRAILDEWENADGHRYDLPEGVSEGRDDDERMRDEAVAMTLDAIVADLAGIYRDHPDYRSEWRP